LFLHFFIGNFHRIERGHGVPQVLCCQGRRFHVERLLRELGQLRFVHALLLECPQCALLNSILQPHLSRMSGESAGNQTFPGPFRSLDICSLYRPSSPSSFFIFTSIEDILTSV
jgi:hypothetical protein